MPHDFDAGEQAQIEKTAWDIGDKVIKRHIESCPIGKQFHEAMAGFKGMLTVWGVIISLITVISLIVTIHIAFKPDKGAVKSIDPPPAMITK